MDFILSYNNNEEVMTFPVVPNEGINLSRSQDNPLFQGVNHELQAIGNMKLATFELSSIFPLKEYPWIRPGATSDGWDYVKTIESARLRRIPFRAVHIDNDGEEIFNLPVTVETFEYGRDRAGDIAYSMSFREYRFAIPEAVGALPENPSAEGEATGGSGSGDGADQNAQTDSQDQANTGSSSQGTYKKLYTESDVIAMAKTMYNEARGIQSKTEIACIGWTILNRVDAGSAAGYRDSIYGVITQPQQFAYSAGAPTVSDYGYDLVALARDVLDRWSREKAGQTDVGRVLPKDYQWYAGDGKHNYFRDEYRGGSRWDYSLPSPYQ